MKLETKNANYCATVVRIHNLVDLQGLDNLKGVNAFGYMALVPKTYEVGQLCILFVAESQLGEDYVKNNNLSRKAELNLDQTQKGYIEENRRVKAVKFRGNVSSALVMPLASLSYLGVDTNEFKEGDTFTHVNGVEVCCKYIKRENVSNGKGPRVGPAAKVCRLDKKLFPEHLDTAHYLRNEHLIGDDETIIVTQKLHGCVDKNTLIETDMGVKTIGEIVDNKLQVKVKSMNVETNEVVFSEIEDFYLLKDDGEWYEIELEDGRTITITGNNPVWLPDLGCYRRVDELNGDENLLVT